MSNTNNKKKLARVPVEISIHLRYLYQDQGLRGKKLLKRYPQFSKATIYRHARKVVGPPDYKKDPTKRKRGRPNKLTEREKRQMLRHIPKLRLTVGSFSIKRLRQVAGVQTGVCDETVRRFLHSEGYHYYHSRKKGLLSQEDLNKRLRFAKDMAQRVDSRNLWQREIAFYLDGAGFQHKYNPYDEAKSIKTMAWRKKDEGLQRNCTAKGSHVGSGGRVLHFMVAISYSKGVVLCEQYEGRINGQMFADFISKHFKSTFERSVNPNSGLFLQDGDPSQNSKKARQAMELIGATKFSIPPRSPDMNPIENLFNYAKANLHNQAIEREITFEGVEQYATRIKDTLENTSVSYINKVIESMDSRMSQIIAAGGRRIKY